MGLLVTRLANHDLFGAGIADDAARANDNGAASCGKELALFLILARLEHPLQTNTARAGRVWWVSSRQSQIVVGKNNSRRQVHS